MPLQYFYSEPDNVLCVKIKVPVVLAEEEVQVIVDNVAILPELAQKIDHIDARLNEFDSRPIFVHENGDRWISIIEEEGWERFGWRWRDHRQPVVKKLLISGILHKQIYYVDKNDTVKHVGEDIPFSTDITLDDPQPVVNEEDVFIQLHHKKIDMRWDLRRGSRLQQTGVMIFSVKVVEERQIFVQVCPRIDRRCERGVNIIKDGKFEAWATDDTPIYWGASNVVRENGGARMGAVANEAASLFQTIRENLVPTGTYRLCFDVTEIPEVTDVITGTVSFTLTAEIVYFDRFGNQIEYVAQSYTATQIPDNSSVRLCLNAVAPRETREVLVRFTFDPNVLNTSAVVIDNVVLECIRAREEFFEEYYGG